MRQAIVVLLLLGALALTGTAPKPQDVSEPPDCSAYSNIEFDPDTGDLSSISVSDIFSWQPTDPFYYSAKIDARMDQVSDTEIDNLAPGSAEVDLYEVVSGWDTTYTVYADDSAVDYEDELPWWDLGTTQASVYAGGSPPSVSGYSVTSGSPVRGGSGTIDVTGSNLTTPAGATSVSIDGLSASITSANSPSDLTVSFSIPSGTYTGGHSLTVSTPLGTSNTVTFTVDDPTPQILPISPSTWMAGTSTPVTITGTGFGSNPTVSTSDSYVTFTVSSASDTTINGTATVNANDPGENVTVTVTANGYGGNGFLPVGSGESQQSNGTILVIPTPPPPPTLSVTWSGAPVSANSVVYTTPTPSLPLSATLVPGRPGITLTGTTSWSMDVTYNGPQDLEYDCEFAATIPANGAWDIGSAFFGGELLRWFSSRVYVTSDPGK